MKKPWKSVRMCCAGAILLAGLLALPRTLLGAVGAGQSEAAANAVAGLYRISV